MPDDTIAADTSAVANSERRRNRRRTGADDELVGPAGGPGQGACSTLHSPPGVGDSQLATRRPAKAPRWYRGTAASPRSRQASCPTVRGVHGFTRRRLSPGSSRAPRRCAVLPGADGGVERSPQGAQISAGGGRAERSRHQRLLGLTARGRRVGRSTSGGFPRIPGPNLDVDPWRSTDGAKIPRSPKPGRLGPTNSAGS